MRLTQLRLHHFRSYSQVALLPPDGLTVFVGENGAGKSTLIGILTGLVNKSSGKVKVFADAAREAGLQF